MNDAEEVRAQLDRLATPDPYGGLDSGQLLARGRRGKQRRRMLAGGGAAAAVVAAVAVTATLLSGAGATTPGNETSVAGTATSTQSARTATKPAELITEAEALRRCRAQWSRDVGTKIPPVYIISTAPEGPNPKRLVRERTVIWMDYDNVPGFYKCTIPAPGESIRGEVVAPKGPDPRSQAPVGADDVALLRACGVLLGGKDLTGWRIVQRASLAGVGTRFVAVESPNGPYAHCPVPAPGTNELLAATTFRRAGPAPSALGPHKFETGSQCRAGCTGWLYDESGRVPAKVVRIRVTALNGRHTDIQVKDGWYAILWADGDPKGQPSGRFTAYDAAGNVVEVDPNAVG